MLRSKSMVAAAFVAVGLATGVAYGQVSAEPATMARADFGFLFGASVRDEACPSPLTADGNIFGMDESGVGRHCAFLYQHMVGIFPEAGPHQVFVEEGFMEAHLAAIRVDVPRWVPDPNFDGPAVIDFEGWALNWERTKNDPGTGGSLEHDQDYLQDWEDYVREFRPETIEGLSEAEVGDVLRASYDEAALDFYIATIEECKRLRPAAKWGFYNYPPKRYYSSEVPRTTPRTIAYGNHTHLGSQLNDRLARLWEASGALYPSTYANRVTVADGVTPSTALKQNSIADDRTYIRSIIEEAVRVAEGKPVYNVCWLRYQNCGAMSDQLLNEINIRNQCEESLLAGSHGLMWWDGIEYRHEYNEVNTLLQTTIYPLVGTTLAMRPVDDPPPPPPPDDPPDDPPGEEWGPEVGTVTFRPDGTRLIVGTSYVPEAPATAVSGFVPDAPDSEETSRAPVQLTIVHRDRASASGGGGGGGSAKRSTAGGRTSSSAATKRKASGGGSSRSKATGRSAYQSPPRVISSRPSPGEPGSVMEDEESTDGASPGVLLVPK